MKSQSKKDLISQVYSEVETFTLDDSHVPGDKISPTTSFERSNIRFTEP